MNAEPNPVKAIFLEALERHAPDQWPAFLDRACADQPDLRGRVEALLEAQREVGTVQHRDLAEGANPGPVAAVDPPPPAGRPGAVIGPYKLVEPIGEGGMGTVWMAQQTEPVKRMVAVKLVKAGMDSKQVIARFEAERQALALMDHANIARVLDAGTTTAGRPYFVMDLVKGVPITKYCDEHRLTPRQRLELFLPVCAAIQHAHQKGIIHRDLKPSNVLVALYDGKPVPKVIDFGVAKAAGQSLTDRTLVTAFGAIVGTLEYMSPEQAEVNQLDIDTRSDIYSLGVLLYELLTGSPPFTRKELEKAGMLEMLRVVREQEPSKPSTKLSTAEGLPTLAANRGTEPAKLTKLVRGELDWIVMKALEKDRNRRYETANGFAMDVQRYLADEAVLACPPSVGYRFRKFARRHTGGLAVAALVLFFLVLLGSGVGWAVRDRSAREVEAARQQGERQARVAGQVESIFGEVDRLEGEQKWPEALAAARRAEAAVAGGEADAATTERVRQRLKELEFIGRLERIRMQRATWIGGKFDYAGADREYARAFRDYGVDVEGLPVETSIDRLKARTTLVIPLAAGLDEWALTRGAVSTVHKADWKRLVAVARGIDPEPLRDRMRAARGQPVSEVQAELRQVADSIDIRAHDPATLFVLAHSLQRVKHTDSAVRLLRDAQRAHPGDFWINFVLAGLLEGQKDYEGAVRFYTAGVAARPTATAALNNLGNALGNQKKFDEAVAAYRRALEIDPNFAYAHVNLGNALRDQKELDEAVAACRKAIELDPKSAVAYSNLGSALRDQKKLDEAVAAHRKAIELDPKYAAAYGNLGAALHDQKKLDEGVAACRKAIEIDPTNAAAYGNLGVALYDQNKLDEAVAACRKAIELDAKFAHAYIGLGDALAAQKELDEAVAAYRKAIELDPKYANAHFKLGVALHGQKKLGDAIAAYTQAVELEPGQAASVHGRIKQMPKEKEFAALSGRQDFKQLVAAVEAKRPLNDRAWELATDADPSRRDPPRAVALAEKAVAEAPEKADYWNTLGAARYRAGDYTGAVAALMKYRELRKDDAEWTNPFFLAMAHWQLDEKDEAKRWFDTGVKWMEKENVKTGMTPRLRAEAAELLGIEKKESGVRNQGSDKKPN